MLPKWYVSGYKNPHKGLHVLRSAARMAGGLRVVRVPMHVPEKFAKAWWIPYRHFVFKFIGHLLLIPRVITSPTKTLLIQEFLTVPLLLISPMLYPFRKKLWFLCQHNLNLASRSVAHRRALWLLCACGFRFVVYESVADWNLAVGSVGGHHVKSIPFPLAGAGIPSPTLERMNPGHVRVGFVGAIRPEKSPEWALEDIFRWSAQDLFEDPIRLVVGTSNKDVLSRWTHRAETYDTSSYDAYILALQACDVVLLPYEAAAYAFRTSGVLAEAIAAGCVVVAPDLPTLRSQVTVPTPIGGLYKNPDGLYSAVRTAVDLIRTRQSGISLREHIRLRGHSSLVIALAGLKK